MNLDLLLTPVHACFPVLDEVAVNRPFAGVANRDVAERAEQRRGEAGRPQQLLAVVLDVLLAHDLVLQNHPEKLNPIHHEQQRDSENPGDQQTSKPAFNGSGPTGGRMEVAIFPLMPLSPFMLEGADGFRRPVLKIRILR